MLELVLEMESNRTCPKARRRKAGKKPKKVVLRYFNVE